MPGFLTRTLLAGLFIAGPALAQIGPPTRLGPPAGPAPTVSGSGGGIAVDTLAPPDPDAVGALGPHDARLPDTLWQGTPRASVLALLPHLAPAAAPALHDLIFRLLASPAASPSGDAPVGALLALRAERLATVSGRPDAALALLQTAPSAQSIEALAEVSADLAFLAGDLAGACATIKAHQAGWQSSYWDQGQVACDALNGRDSDARLGLDVLREAKVKDDGFAALVDRALGGASKLPDGLPAPQPIALALLAKAGAPLPKRTLDGAGLAELRAIALGAGFPPDQRLAAAEKAATFGAVPPEALAQAYLALPLDPADKESPLNQAQSVPGPHGRAILFAAAHDAEIPAAKANFLALLLQQGAKADLYFALAQAARPMLLQIPPGAELASVAPDLARALYAVGQPSEAAAWLAVAGKDQAAALQPLAHIASGSAGAWGDQALTDLLGGKDLGQRRAVLAVQLLAALGRPAPDALILPLLDAKVAVPSSATPVALIEGAASGHRIGFTVLAIGTALADQGALAPGITLAQSVAALRQVGLDDDATRLAIDGAIAAGL